MINHQRPIAGINGHLFLGVVFITAIILFASCVGTKNRQYFQTLQLKDTTLNGFVTGDFETKIVPGDQVAVSVSSLNPVEDALFNNAGQGGGTSGTSAGASIVSAGGYTVQPDGSIFFHRIGNMAVGGLTRRQLATTLESKLLPFLKEPVVRVTFLNHKVTVLGEVARPGVVGMQDDKLSLIDALVLSGDITATGTRNNVTIIREEGNEKKVKHVNLQNNSIFNSEWYYLKPNDIVFVSADTELAEKEDKRRRLQTTLSLVASFASLVIIILDRVIK